MTVFKQLLNDYKQCLLRGDHSDGAAAYLAIVAEHEQAARRAPAAPVPQGWKRVPVEPTENMYMCVGYYKDDPAIAKRVIRRDYQAMLAAAPQPPEAYGLKSGNRTTKTVPQWYVGGVMTGNRVALEFESQENAETWFEKFCDDYDASATQSTDAEIKVSQNHFDESPVQMPEPFAYVEHHKAGDNLWFDHPGGKHSELYTEQQVRQLLDTNGIKANK